MAFCKHLPTFMWVLYSLNGVELAPWSDSDMPICTSQSGLCDMTFEIQQNEANRSLMKYTSSSQVCSCPGKSKCPSNTTNSSRVMYLEISSPEQIIQTTLSYCNRRSIPKNVCKPNELSVTLRGYGPIIDEIVGDVMCKCNGPLQLHRARPDGMYSIREYTCGRPTCEVNRTTEPVCERVVRTASTFGVSTEIPCDCPEGFQCNINNPNAMFSLFGRPTEFHCKTMDTDRNRLTF